jgi:hypothetical protein
MKTLSTPPLETFNFQWENAEKPGPATLKTINTSLMRR